MASQQSREKDAEIIRKIFTIKTKPWSTKKAPIVCTWQSSIPEKIIEIYGRNRFKKSNYSNSTRISWTNLNHSREFLHTLTKLEFKAFEKESRSEKCIKKKIRLDELSQGVDLISQNKYIEKKLKERPRSQLLSRRLIPKQ